MVAFRQYLLPVSREYTEDKKWHEFQPDFKMSRLKIVKTNCIQTPHCRGGKTLGANKNMLVIAPRMRKQTFGFSSPADLVSIILALILQKRRPCAELAAFFIVFEVEFVLSVSCVLNGNIGTDAQIIRAERQNV